MFNSISSTTSTREPFPGAKHLRKPLFAVTAIAIKLPSIVAFAAVLSLNIAARAETRLVKVGNPVFDVTGGLVVIPALNTHDVTHEPWLANMDRVLDEVRGGTHITLGNDCFDCPLKPHDGPYDQEVLQGMVDAGYLITDAFTQNDDLASPGTLFIPAVVTPNADAPLGPSFENANGAVLPNDIFPLSYRFQNFVNGRQTGTVSRTVDALDGKTGPFTDRFGEVHDLDFTGLNYSHLMFSTAIGRNEGGPPASHQGIGENRIVRTIRDANGNGWDVIEEYRIVAEDTNIAGDLNYSGALDAGDYNIMRQNIELGSSHERLDLNGDSFVDVSDLTYWDEELFQLGPGDANRDGQVSAADLNAVAVNWQTEGGATWEQGDFTGDGNVDAADLNVVALNWNNGVVPASAAAPAPVPEPSSIALLLLGLCGLARRYVG